jgi:hypothetical protein
MFERVISQTIQTITTQTLRERPMIPLVEILEDERIPTRLKPFFETEVRWWLYNEMLARQANKRFDYEHPELASLLSYLEQVQFRHARFEREDFTTVLDSAVKLTYNYLCRPQTTLKWYIFRGQPVMPLREVMLRFGAFIDYPYFPTVFAEWVERKQRERPTFDAISATEFERVIRRIDDQILLNCTVEDLLGIIYPIFEFIGEGAEMIVPVDSLIIYFDDKNIKRLVEFLEEVRTRGRDMVSREDFVVLLDELLNSAEGEPEADFSDVYQNDELDDVVRRHLEAGTTPVTPIADMPPVESPVYQPEPEPMAVDYPEEGMLGPEAQSSLPSTIGSIDPEDHRRFTEAFGTIVPSKDVEHADPVVGDTDPILETESEEYVEVAEPAETGTVAEAGSNGDVDEMVSTDNAPQEEEERPVIGTESESLNGHAGHEVTEPEAMPEGGAAGAEHDNASNEEDEEEDDEDENDDDDSLERHVDRMQTVPHADYRYPTEPLRSDATAGRSELATEVSTMDSQSDDAQGGELEDVRKFITPLLERKVLKRVFNKDRESYEGALDRLNQAATWRAASQVLDEVFIRFDVDPYSRTAIRFTDSIYGRYLPRN